jgi:hypothetical protein
MRRMLIIALATTMTAVAVPAAMYYFGTRSNDDPLGDTLRAYGFVPITPPSTLMNVGSLYYVDAAVKDFKAICHAQKADLEGEIIVSPSWEMQENLERNGRFTSGVKVDVGPLLDGSIEDRHVQRVKFSLTDIVLEEIPLGTNWLIFRKLMEKPECNEVAMRYIRAGGYVCQGQKMLQATAEFKLDRDVRTKLATHAKTDDIKELVKAAVETQSKHSVVEREGRLFAGSALKYGVSMTPICLAPPDGRFERLLPRTMFDRIANFFLFRIVEPLLPAKVDRSEVAQNTYVTQGKKN